MPPAVPEQVEGVLHSADLVHCVITTLPSSLSEARLVNRAWRDALVPLFEDAVVAQVLLELIWELEYEASFDVSGGTCLGCGAVGNPCSQCLECGAPVEPDDGSCHYQFGWVDGPRPQSQQESQ